MSDTSRLRVEPHDVLDDAIKKLETKLAGLSVVWLGLLPCNDADFVMKYQYVNNNIYRRLCVLFMISK